MTTTRGERTRDEIVVAAREHLLTAGLDRFSLREVARASGLAPSAVYNHFRDKDELILTLAMASVATLGAYLAEVPAGPARDRLLGLGRAYVRFAEEHGEEYRVIFDCLANPPHTWDEYVGVAHPFSLIVEACQQGLEEGALQDRDAEGAAGIAYGLWCTVAGHVHLHAKHLQWVDGPFDELLDSTVLALLDGYAPTASPAPTTTAYRQRDAR